MIVVDQKAIPIYEAECEECHSRIQYMAAEVSFTGYIVCPVCGMAVWANKIRPVRFAEKELGEEFKG